MNQQKLSDRARRAKDAAAGGVAKAAGRAKSSTSRMSTEALGVAKLLRSTTGQVRDRLFPECALPLFLLPTGSANSDFCCVFDFNEPIEVLRSHRFPRPALVVWASRRDFDRDRLIRQLKSEFTRQFETSIDQTRAALEADLNELEDDKRKTWDQASGPLGSFVGTIASAALLDVGGITGLIVLATSMRKGRRALTPLTDYFEASGKVRGRRKDMERDLRELEAQFAADNKVFQRSVRRLEVQIHPELRNLVRGFFQVDSISLTIDDSGDAAHVPDISRYLRSTEYQVNVPERYGPVINAALNTERGGN